MTVELPPAETLEELTVALDEELDSLYSTTSVTSSSSKSNALMLLPTPLTVAVMVALDTERRLGSNEVQSTVRDDPDTLPRPSVVK